MARGIVFLIGAGASREFTLPLGHELLASVSRLLDLPTDGVCQSRGDRSVYEALSLHAKSTGTSLDTLVRAGRKFRAGLALARSIDDLLAAHRRNESMALCAKLAIVRTIAEAESRSPLSLNGKPTLDFAAVSNTWLYVLWSALTEGADIGSVEERFSRIAFVVFNYDRCLEQFLRHALCTKYDLDIIQATRAMSLLKIHHPYGTVGPLPWQNANQFVPFGGTPDAQGLLCATRTIGTISYEQESPNLAARMSRRSLHDLVGQAELLVFLGMAYHPGNVELVSPEQARTRPGQCHGTAKGLSQSEREAARLRLRKLAGPGGRDGEVHLHDETCLELVRRLGQSLVPDEDAGPGFSREFA